MFSLATLNDKCTLATSFPSVGSVELWIVLEHLPLEDAWWESVVSIKQSCPLFPLEEKAAHFVLGGSTDEKGEP